MRALLADALQRLYPDHNALRRVLEQARVETAHVTFNGRASTTAWSAATQTIHQGRATALVDSMLVDYPTDPWLNALSAQLARRGEPNRSTDAP